MAVLAGGESRRFGSPKQLQMWHGRTLLDRAVDLADSLTTRTVIIGGSEYQPETGTAEMYEDIFPGNGPLGGIHAALVHCKKPYAATLPCDMPLMSAGIFRLLALHRNESHPVVAETEYALEPLICIWPAAALALIEERLKKGMSGPIPVLDMLEAVRIPVYRACPEYDPAMFTNINTRSQLPGTHR